MTPSARLLRSADRPERSAVLPVRHTRTSARRNHVRPDRRAGAGDLAVLRDLRADMEIGLGCVSTEPGRVDPVGEIVGRVEAVLEHLDAGRITLNPDCGFAPGSGAAVGLDEVDQKLKNEAAARVLRDKYT